MRAAPLVLVPLLFIAPGAREPIPLVGVEVAGAASGPPPPSALPRTPAAGTPAAPRLRLPLDGPVRVVNPFDEPDGRYGPGHRGVDLAAATGDTVVAAADGTVAFAGTVATKGVVSIQHPGGLRTTYEPVRGIVRTGDHVVAGQPIGRVQPGHPRCRPETCLHWGVRTAPGEYLDPMLLIRPWRVVLKPWAGGDG